MSDIIVAVSLDKEVPITSKVFHVQVFETMPQCPYCEPTSETIKVDDSVLVNPKALNKKSIVSKNYLTAVSMTDYRTKYNNADVFKMKEALGVTEMDRNPGDENGTYPIGDAPAVKDTHVHGIKQPLELHEMVVENLNQETVLFGEEILIVKISEQEYRAIHIPNKIPLLEEE